MRRIKAFFLAVCLLLTMTVPALAANDVEKYVEDLRMSMVDLETYHYSPNRQELFLYGIASNLMQLSAAVKKGGGTVSEQLRELLAQVEAAIAPYDTQAGQEARSELAKLRENLGLNIGAVTPGDKAKVTGFDDVAQNHWAYGYIMTIVNQGAIDGTRKPVDGIGHFEPEREVTLGQLLAIAVRLVAPEKAAVPAAGEHWAMPYYRVAEELDWLWANTENAAEAAERLEEYVQREQMAYYLVGVAQTAGQSLPYTAAVEKKAYTQESFQRAACMVYYNGIMQGDGMNRFNAGSYLTRMELATVFCRLMNYTPRTLAVLPAGERAVDVHKNFYKGISEDGYTIDDPEGKKNGLVIAQYSRQYNMEALTMTRAGVDDKGVYLTFTAPQLPAELVDGFHFSFWYQIYAPNGNYFADGDTDGDVRLKPGETQTVHFLTWEGERPVARSQMGNLSVVAELSQDETNNSLISHRINFQSQGNVWEHRTDDSGGEGTWMPFDDSVIWAGVEK